LNGFDQVYLQMAERYFEQATARQASEDFYRDILKFTKKKSAQDVFNRTQQMMKDSITYWKQSLPEEKEK
jgi:DNA-binding FadR family transcriptional regulator